MAIVTTDNRHYHDIAEAIRLKFGTTGQYKPEEMASAVMNLDSYEEYDGTISGVGTLENTSWANIKAIAASGGAENCWAVGDTKSVVVNGTVGNVTFSNQTYYVYVLGFNHNATYEGNGIHFGCFKTASFGGVDVIPYGFAMNTSSTNTGGWKSSQMRNTYCPAFFNTLPTELQAVIVECPKYTDNKGGTGGAESNVNATQDKIFIPAEFELFGKRTRANSYEQNYQKQYAYFAAGNPTVRYNSTATSTAEYYWIRSCTLSTDVFCLVGKSGEANAYSASHTEGMFPCFKVG